MSQNMSQEQVPPFKVEIVEVLKKWNVNGDIQRIIINYLLGKYNGYVSLYSHDEWGSCREWKHVIMNEDGTYLEGGTWIDNSSRKNAHKRKIMEIAEFLEKYGGKNLMIYVYESPSCNKSKEFSFKAIFRVFK